MTGSQSITIPAAVNNVPGIAEYNGSGKVFACISTTADFQIRFDFGNLEHVSAGTVLGDSAAKPFRTIYFLNSSGNDIDITFTVSNSAINPATLNTVGNLTIAAVKDAPTYTKAFAAGKIPASTTITFTGLDTTKQRRQIVIQNLDGSSALSIQDNTGMEGFYLAAGKAVTLATNGVIKISNITLADINCDVLETFYV